MSLEQVLAAVGSPLVAVEVDKSELAKLASAWVDAGLTVRVVRGAKMTSAHALFDEVAAAFQFPLYFGENWDALDECLSDLEWLPRQRGFVVVIADAGRVLEAEASLLRVFVGSLVRAADQWALPVADGEWWDRPAVPFHAVLQVESLRAVERWQAVGAQVVPFDR